MNHRLVVGSFVVAACVGGAWANAQSANKSEAKPATPTAAAPMAPAVASAGMTAPKPAAELAQLKYMVGTWQCTGQVPASPWGPAHATQGTAKIGPELEGFWLGVRYDESKAAENRHPMRFRGHWGYNPATLGFVAGGVDNMGGWATQNSKGWEGSALVWTGNGVMGGQTMPVRDTFEKKGDNEVVHRGEINMNGTWTLLDEETCTRSAEVKKEEPKKEESVKEEKK